VDGPVQAVVTQSRAPLVQSATAAADGTATVTFRSRGPHVCEAKQIGVRMPSAGGAIGQMYFNGSPVSPFVPAQDAIAGEPSQLFGPGDEIVLAVTGATPGSVLTASLFYNQLD